MLPGTANRWQWDRSAFLELVHFGKWIFVSSILGFLVANGDRLLLGWMVDSTVLGVYVIAFLVYSAIEQAMARIIISVGFPALSEVARNRRDLKAAYYRFHAIIAKIAYFCAGALMVSGEALIRALYDPRYIQAGWMLQILATALLTIPFQIAVQSFMALGKPHLLSSILLVRLIGLCVGIPLGFYFSELHGALWGVVVSQIASVPLLVFYAARFGLLDLRKELIVLPMLLLGASAGKVLVWGIGN